MEIVLLVVAGLIVGSVVLRLSLWVLKTIYAWAPFILMMAALALALWYEKGSPSLQQMKETVHANHSRSVEH